MHTAMFSYSNITFILGEMQFPFPPESLNGVAEFFRDPEGTDWKGTLVTTGLSL